MSSKSNKSKQKTFQLNIMIDTFITAEIKADSIKEALETAEQMTTDQLCEAPGTKEDESHKITGIFEI